MLIQLGNVAAGFILSGPVLSSINGLKEPVARFERALAPYRQLLGLAIFVAGVLNLLERMSVMYFSYLTGGYPQALLAMAMGVLLAGHYLDSIPGIKSLRGFLTPYSGLIGVAGLVVGLYSII